MNRWIEGSIVLGVGALAGLSLTNALIAGGWPNWLTFGFCVAFFAVRGTLRWNRRERLHAAWIARHTGPGEIPTLRLDVGGGRIRGGVAVQGVPAELRLVVPCPACGCLVDAVARTTDDPIALECPCGAQISVRLNIKRMVRDKGPSAN